MKFNGSKKIITVCLVAILLIVSALPAFAETDKTYLDVTVTGTSGDYSYFQIKRNSDKDYYVYLNYPSGRDRVVLKTYLINSEYEERGKCDIYEGTSNTGQNTGKAGYSYRLHCLRQYWYDGKATITGIWNVDC